MKYLDININCLLLGQLWEGLAGAWGCWCLSPTLTWISCAWGEFLWVSGRVKWQMEKKCLCSAEPRWNEDKLEEKAFQTKGFQGFMTAGWDSDFMGLNTCTFIPMPEQKLSFSVLSVPCIYLSQIVFVVSDCCHFPESNMSSGKIMPLASCYSGADMFWHNVGAAASEGGHTNKYLILVWGLTWNGSWRMWCIAWEKKKGQVLLNDFNSPSLRRI